MFTPMQRRGSRTTGSWPIGRFRHGSFTPSERGAAKAPTDHAPSAHDDPRLAGTQAGVAGLDDLVDDPEPLVEWGERRLHRVEGEPLHLAESDPERRVDGGELARQGDVRHQ